MRRFTEAQRAELENLTAEEIVRSFRQYLVVGLVVGFAATLCLIGTIALVVL